MIDPIILCSLIYLFLKTDAYLKTLINWYLKTIT